MPTFAELRERAAKAADAGKSKFQDTKDRHSSVPIAKTNWDPYSKKPPPPPPPAKARATSTTTHPTASGPPPVKSSSRPGASQQAGGQSEDSNPIDWANLSPEDKHAFFEWLDQYFSRLLNVTLPPRETPSASRNVPERPHMVVHKSAAHPSPAPSVKLGSHPPPPVATWSRPKGPPTNVADTNGLFTLSHPPATAHGSAGIDLAHFFHPSTHWSSAWYTTDNLLPPPLHGSKDHSFSAGWQSRNSEKTVFSGILFSDLSICWSTVEFSTSQNADPNDPERVRRSAVYLPRPQPLGEADLVAAHETYGDTIAAFAESYVDTGEYCARGECWDLAHEALKYFEQFDYVPKPVPSLSRTHGHLIYEGNAQGRGNTVGRWRGGDTRVRRGDIVEWRKVKIGLVNGPPGSWAILGDPDHTAVIVRDSVIAGGRRVRDGDSVRPAELGSLEVVEQSVGSPPSRKEYDLEAFEEGEMWIYRPIGMEKYLGFLLSATPPDGLPTMSL
ncbi:hypothetical protein HGRIS_007016 [Hohenbuehelia grisea]|uniref:BBC1/AIM3 cysteine proteinase-fold domain-containing protein n=1 Tax=Hohenbuehelia grisea TaxID=104357 RepID=A0ABR3JB71_9AGAR